MQHRQATGGNSRRSGPEERLTSGEYVHTPHSWSPDGKFLAFIEENPETAEVEVLVFFDLLGHQTRNLEPLLIRISPKLAEPALI